MIDLASIQNRVRQILDDEAASRFSDELLDNAIRMALQRIDEKIPLVRSVDHPVTSSGRDQVVNGLLRPLFVIRIRLNQEPIRSGYVYTLTGESAALHFAGSRFPQSGETLQVEYGAQNTLAGLDGSTASSLPEAAATALESGAAGYACLWRAASVAEAYGARPGESARLAEQGRLWLATSVELIGKLHSLQDFSYPVGFALDEWDEKGD